MALQMNGKVAVARGGGARILIVDDTPANIEIAVNHLEARGYEILVARNAQETLQRVRLVQPDLILMDVRMPGMDGFELCRHLGADVNTREIPVIFMTALNSVQDKMTAFSAGGVDFVSKPFQVEELLARVQLHLALRQSQKLLEAQNAQLRASELRYRRLFEASTDGILLFDFESGEVTGVNEAFENLFGYPRRLVLGRPFSEFLPFRELAQRDGLIDELNAQERLMLPHVPLRRSDGETIDVEFFANRFVADRKVVVQCHVRDVTQRRRSEDRIRHMAMHDDLTDLPNRNHLVECLSREIASAGAEFRQVAVLLLDLDHFKHINDSLGHEIGDRVLEVCASRLLSGLRDTDLAARLGGDEFVLVIPDVRSDMDAAAVAAKFVRELSEPVLVDEHLLYVGASIGISRFPRDGADATTLLRAADTAMYAAKYQGRGTWAFFTEALDRAAQRRLSLVNQVRGARASHALKVYYQPQVDIATGAVVGVEALLRWVHPDEGEISPQEFVPLLEEAGLMVDIGHWVLETACRQAVQWRAEGLAPLRVAVNVSTHQFYRGDIVRNVARVLRETGLPPEQLELELTETLTLEDSEDTVGIMQGLKQLGVLLTLDDFGTGWSALSYLRRFPLDRIKIDRSFTQDILSQREASAIVRNIISLGRDVGLSCIAEGVENADQLEYLKQQMCSEVQGFLFSPAVPAEEIASLVGAGTADRSSRGGS